MTLSHSFDQIINMPHPPKVGVVPSNLILPVPCVLCRSTLPVARIETRVQSANALRGLRTRVAFPGLCFWTNAIEFEIRSCISNFLPKLKIALLFFTYKKFVVLVLCYSKNVFGNRWLKLPVELILWGEFQVSIVNWLKCFMNAFNIFCDSWNWWLFKI